MSWYYNLGSDAPSFSFTRDNGTVQRFGSQPGESQRFETNSTCEMVRFIRSHISNPEELESGFFENLEAASIAEGCAIRFAEDGGIEPQPAPGATPLETNPASVGGDSADLQGAPTPSTSGGVGGNNNTATDSQPPPTQEPTRPAEGQPHASHADETAQQATTGADPVNLFAGILYLEDKDIEVPNTVLPLAFKRFYRSGAPAYGPLGWNWDHNHNLYLRELNNGDIALWRNLHEDLFGFNGTEFEPPRGVFERLQRLAGLSHAFEITMAGGVRMRFERPAAWIDAERIPIVWLKDRHGNQMRYFYGAEDRLIQVIDDQNRFLQFEYDDCGLLLAVEDHAGRRCSYTHNEETQNLVCVNGPASSDFPEGITRIYHYMQPFVHPKLRHSIVRVEDSEKNVYLQNEYETDPSAWHFARITQQYYGGYLFQFRYKQLQYVPANSVFINIPALRVEKMNPDFNVESYTFNYRGDLLDRRFRLTKDKSYRVVVWQYEYDEQGNQTVVTSPDGAQLINVYDHNHVDPCMRANLLRTELSAASGFPAPSRIVWRGKYESSFQLLIEETNELNALTRYKYDFDLTPAATDNSGKLKQIHLPPALLPDGTSQTAVFNFSYNNFAQVTEIVFPDGVRQTIEYGNAGEVKNRIKREVLDVAGASIVHSYEYNHFGYIDSYVDGNGYVSKEIVNALGLTEKLQLPAVNGVSAEYEFHYNSDKKLIRSLRPKGDYSETGLLDDFIVDEFDRDVLAYPRKYSLGSNLSKTRQYRICTDYKGLAISTVNPDQSEIKRLYDERGLLLKETLIGKLGSTVSAKYTYNRAGKLIEKTNTLGENIKYKYDGFARVSQVTLANGTIIKYKWLAGDLLESIEYIGDDGTGLIRQLAFSRFEYDKRGRKIKQVSHAFATDPLSTTEISNTFYYDSLDRLFKSINHRGAVNTIEYDGVGRTVKMRDPNGNEQRFEYDDNGNVIRKVIHYQSADGTVSLNSKDYVYDERNRLTVVVEPDGAATSFEYDDRDLTIKTSDNLGIVQRSRYDAFANMVEKIYDFSGLDISHQWLYDNMSRLIRYTDPSGQISNYHFDDIGRLYETNYPNGFSSTKYFNTQGQVLSEKLASGVEFQFSYDSANRLRKIKNTFVPATIKPIADHDFRYDGLDRLVLAKSGSNTITRAYDSIGRIIAEQTLGDQTRCSYLDATGQIEKTWSDGRTEQISLDLNGLVTEIEQSASGGLGNIVNKIAAFKFSGHEYLQADFPGDVKLKNVFDQRRRLLSTTAKSTSGLNELIEYRYDTVNRLGLEQIQGLRNYLDYFVYDNKYRLIQARSDFSASLSSANTQLEHDIALDAVKAASISASRVSAYAYNDADERTQLKQTGVADRNYSYFPGHRIDNDGVNWHSYHVDGSLSSDGSYNYEIDAFGRIIDIKSGAISLCKIEYDSLSRASIITEQGQPARALNYLGDTIVQEKQAGVAVKQFTTHPHSGVALAYHSAAQTHIPLYDARYNLLALLDTHGNIVETYRYKPFGLPQISDVSGSILATSAFGIAPVFGGQQYLQSVGLYLSKHRLMQPSNGVYLSADPSGYLDSPSLYAYVAQNPVDLIDPDGDLAFLAGLAIAAVVGAVVSGGINAARQGIAIAEGAQEGWDWGQFGTSVGVGALAGPLLVVAPELAVPLAVYGVGNGIAEISAGNYATGTFDIVTSVAPFGFKGVRANTFARGSLFSRGPTAGWSARAGRLSEIGTHALYRRFYRGTTETEVNQTLQNQSLDVDTVIARQTDPNNIPPRLGPGLYFTENLQSGPFEPGTALSHARKHGYTQGDNPGILAARIFRPRFWLRARNPQNGIRSRIPQVRMNNIGQQETFIPESQAHWFNQHASWFEVPVPTNLQTGLAATGEFAALMSALFPIVVPHPNESESSK